VPGRSVPTGELSGRLGGESRSVWPVLDRDDGGDYFVYDGDNVSFAPTTSNPATSYPAGYDSQGKGKGGKGQERERGALTKKSS